MDCRSKEKHKLSEYIGVIIASSVFIYLLNNIQNYNFSFITDGFYTCVWLFNLPLSITVLANALFIFYHEEWFRNLNKIIINVLNLIALFILFTIFPFNLSHSYQLVVQVFFILLIISACISAILNFFKLAKSLS